MGLMCSKCDLKREIFTDASLLPCILPFLSTITTYLLPPTPLSISAETDKRTLEINDSLYLTITVSGDSASVPEPSLPQMNNFNVYSSGRSQNISIINGKIATSVAFTYILTPRFIGKQTIPPIPVFNGREKRLTPEIEVEVVKAAAPAQAPRPQSAPGSSGRQQSGSARRQPTSEEMLFMTAEPDKKSAYPNEQVNLTVRFYTAVPLTSNPQYIPPTFKNLISEDLPPVKNGESVIKGVRYTYSEIKTALFGIEEGQAVINPASVFVQIHGGGAIDPFDPNFFQQFFAMNSGQGETRQLTSNAASLKINPVPPGAPASFNGAVGEFTFTAEPDRREIRTGEALNLSLTIAGKGNLKTLLAPRLPEMQDFKVYDTMSSLDISKNNDVIGGKKTFTTVLIPRTEGRRVIPKINFTYLDPETKTYRELSVGPFELTVEKGDGDGKSVSFAPGGPAAAITPLGSDIRYVSDKTAAPLAGTAGAHLRFTGLGEFYPGGHSALMSLDRAPQRFPPEEPAALPLQTGPRRSARDLADAANKLKAGQPKETASVLYDSLLDYLSDKSGCKVGGMTMKRTLALLKEKFPAAGEGALDEIKDLWQQLEALHFSPGGATQEEARDMLDKYTILLTRLEKEFRK